MCLLISWGAYHCLANTPWINRDMAVREWTELENACDKGHLLDYPALDKESQLAARICFQIFRWGVGSTYVVGVLADEGLT